MNDIITLDELVRGQGSIREHRLPAQPTGVIEPRFPFLFINFLFIGQNWASFGAFDRGFRQR